MKRIAIALALILVPSLAMSATCGDRQRFLDALASKYGETRHGAGLTENGAIIEVFASDLTGSWTIIITPTPGKSCIVATGQSYEIYTETLAPDGDPT